MRLAEVGRCVRDDEERRRRIIRDRLTLQHVPGLGVPPEDALLVYTATPKSRLSSVVGDAAPYWAHSWAGGLALVRYLADHPQTVADRAVIDLGTGNGLVALAAGRAGAQTVTGCDCDPWAVTAASLNAEANGMAASFLLGDVTSMRLAPADVVLVGDLFYDTQLARRMGVLLEALAKAGAVVLIGDPGRRSFPAARFHKLASYAVSDFGLPADAVGATAGVYTV